MLHSHHISTHQASVDHEQPNIRMLDRALANGAPHDGTPDWLLRSQELCSRSERHELARSLVIILQAARHAAENSPTHLDTPAILRCGGRLLALVSLLETNCQFRVQGLALAWLLLEEPGSPLFRARRGQTLEQALDEITAAL
jgi:hypothetical protein